MTTARLAAALALVLSSPLVTAQQPAGSPPPARQAATQPQAEPAPAQPQAQGSPAQAPAADPSAKPRSWATALGVVVFPSRNQTPEQQASEEYECYLWSREQTGIDPFAPPPPVDPKAAAAQAPQGAAAAGAAKGAVVGAIVGYRPGAAAAGAVVGAAAGSAKQQQMDQAAAQKAQAEANRQRADVFRRGYTACLEGKGYSAK